MLGRFLHLQEVEALHHVDTIDLLWLCVANRQNAPAWSELLRRILPKLKHFVRGALYQWQGNTRLSRAQIFSNEIQERDLIQITIVRLLESDCALLKRFYGKTGDDLLAYLAIVSKSAVRDVLRRQGALKRGADRQRYPHPDIRERIRVPSDPKYDESAVERQFLARELADLGECVLGALSGPSSIRDRLIFQLYFYHDLSLGQIARCQGINLTKAGVEQVLIRLKKQIRTLAVKGISNAAA